MMRIEPVELRAGDVLVISTPEVVTADVGAEIKQRVQEQFPEYKIVVLTAGMHFGVIRSAA